MSTDVLARIIGPLLLVLGLSVLMYAKAWLKLVGEIEKNHLLFLANAYMAMILGLAIVTNHNSFQGFEATVISLVGWIALSKGVFYFLAPGSWIKALINRSKCLTCLYLSGLVSTVLGALITYVHFVA